MESAQELFTRKVPFYDCRGIAIIIRVMRGQPDRPTEENTNFRMTEQWWKALSSCWECDHSLRPSISSITAEVSEMVCS